MTINTKSIENKCEELEAVLNKGGAREYLLQTEQQVQALVTLDETGKVPSLQTELERIQEALVNHAEEAFVRNELASLDAIIAGQPMQRFE